MLFLKQYFDFFLKVSRRQQKHRQLPSMQNSKMILMPNHFGPADEITHCIFIFQIFKPLPYSDAFYRADQDQAALVFAYGNMIYNI